MKKYEKFLKIALIVIIAATAILTVLGMVLGPIGYESTSVKLSQSACVLAVFGIGTAFFIRKAAK